MRARRRVHLYPMGATPDNSKKSARHAVGGSGLSLATLPNQQVERPAAADVAHGGAA